MEVGEAVNKPLTAGILLMARVETWQLYAVICMDVSENPLGAVSLLPWIPLPGRTCWLMATYYAEDFCRILP